MRILTTILFALAVLSVRAHADVIVLTNGDRVTGTVVTTTDGKLTVKTEFMGEVQIDRKAVASIESDTPLVVTFENGQTVVGTVATEQQQVVVTQEDDSKVERPIAALTAVRDNASQQAFQREQQRQTNPGWLDFWSFKADLGLASASGNAETTTINSGASIERVTGFDKTRLTFEQIFSTQHTTEPFGANANSISGGARYERDVRDDIFAFGNAAFDFDEFQDLDLRSALGGGFGWRILDSERNKWYLDGGANWNREKFATGLLRNSAEASISEASEHALGSILHVHQSFSIFPNLTDGGEYRFRARAGADVKLNSHLAVTFLILNRYLSNPVADKKKDDLLFSTGLQFNWAQQ